LENELRLHFKDALKAVYDKIIYQERNQFRIFVRRGVDGNFRLPEELDTLTEYADTEGQVSEADFRRWRYEETEEIRRLANGQLLISVESHLQFFSANGQQPFKNALEQQSHTLGVPSEVIADLLAFFADRLKVYLRDKGARHDLIDAVFALPGQDDLLMIVRRVEALGAFLDTEDGKNLLAGYRRAANILKAEEKKGETFVDAYDPALLKEPQEQALAAALATAARDAAAQVAQENFEAAMRALSALRAPVDAFFTAVTVNAEEPALRVNRLRLLGALRDAVHTVADFSKIGG